MNYETIKLFRPRTLGIGLIGLACLSAACAGPANDAGSDEDTGEVAQGLAALPCVAGGPSSADGSDAAALNPQLANKMRGHMTAYNVSCARAVVQAVKARGLNERAAAIAISTVIVETSIANLDGGDRDSVGLFQQRASWGTFAERTNPVIATNKFLDTMLNFYPNNAWNTAPIGDVAADVQRPAAQYRYRYGVEANDSIKIANALWGSSKGSSLSGDARAEIATLRDNGDIEAWYNAQGFAAMPWGGSVVVGQGFTDPNRVRFADLDGDGRKEILTIRENGDIEAWHNARGFEAMPWGGSVIVGRGFTDPSRVRFADLSGDGRAEIMAIRDNGDIEAWYNAQGFAAMPWGGSVIVGQGFTDPNRVIFTDLSGDGRSEILTLRDNGDIEAWYNAQGFAAMPWGGSVIVGQGFTDPNRVRFADLSGDGRSEIMAIRDNGDIEAWYNAQGFAAMPWGGSVIVGTGFVDPTRVLFP